MPMRTRKTGIKPASVNRNAKLCAGLLLCLLPVLVLFSATTAGAVDAVTIPDAYLEQLLREKLEIPADEPITEADMESLTVIRAEMKGIRSLQGLQYARNLQRLYLRGNLVADLSPLKRISSLMLLDLRNNRLVEIQPLVENCLVYDGLGPGSDVDLRINPLDTDDPATKSNIQILKDNGVFVQYDPPPGIDPFLVIETRATLPTAETRINYRTTLEASGGEKPYSWDLIAGSLPRGLSLGATGIISGRPTTEGSYSFTVRVTDDAGETAEKRLTLPVEDTDPEEERPSIRTTTLPAAEMSVQYEATLRAVRGTDPYRWSIASGRLPAGLDLSENGRIYGIPAEHGLFYFTVQVTDDLGASSRQTLSLRVADTIVIVTDILAPAVRSGSYAAKLWASGGTPPYTWRLTAGGLPTGLHLTREGRIAGIPVRTGTFPFAVRVRDFTGREATATLELRVESRESPHLKTEILPTAILGEPYLHYLEVEMGTTPFEWSLLSGKLPTGLTLFLNGAVSGTPEQFGHFVCRVRVTDGAGLRSERDIVLRVKEARRTPEELQREQEAWRALQQQIRVEVRGLPLLMDTDPILARGRLLVPLRAVAEALEAVVSWSEKDRVITVEKGTRRVTLMAGSRLAVVNGQSRQLDVPPVVLDGRALVPLRFLSEHFGLQVRWSDAEQAVFLQ